MTSGIHRPLRREGRTGRVALSLPCWRRPSSIAATIAHGRPWPPARGTQGETFWEYRHHRPEDGARSPSTGAARRAAIISYVRETEWEAANASLSLARRIAGHGRGCAGTAASKRDRAAVCLIARRPACWCAGASASRRWAKPAVPRSGRPALELRRARPRRRATALRPAWRAPDIAAPCPRRSGQRFSGPAGNLGTRACQRH
jgi:hypothetical protein